MVIVLLLTVADAMAVALLLILCCYCSSFFFLHRLKTLSAEACLRVCDWCVLFLYLCRECPNCCSALLL